MVMVMVTVRRGHRYTAHERICHSILFYSNNFATCASYVEVCALVTYELTYHWSWSTPGSVAPSKSDLHLTAVRG